MPFEVRSKNNRFYVVDTKTNAVIGRGFDDESDAEDKADEKNFREETRERLGRMPVTEMTAEEKAAAYDKLMADKAKEADSNIPPKQDDKDNKPPPDNKLGKGKRFTYWGDVENEA
jgi:lipase chaperone LimK